MDSETDQGEITRTMLDGVMDAAVRNSKTEPKDYKGPGGLLYCGVCKTPKEVRLKLPEGLYGPGAYRTVPCLCKHRQEELRKKKEQDEFQERMYRVKRLKESSMMESAYRDASFARYIETDSNRKAEDIAKKYAANFAMMMKKGQGLLFYGPVGTGKSFAAACIADALMNDSVPVVMISTTKIVQSMSQFGSRGEIQNFTDCLQRSSLLILDDLGAERNTDFAIEQIYNVVDARSRSGKPMIVTTNVSLSDMMNSTDIRYRRIYDRVLETCYPVQISGRSFRMMSAEERFDEMHRILE